MIKEKSNPEEWQIGDTFVLKITKSDSISYNGRYFIFTLIDKIRWNKKNEIPLFRIKITSNSYIPETKEKIDDLEYVQTHMVLWEDRFMPLDGKEINNAKKKTTFFPDEYGYLSEYQIAVIILKNKDIPENFEYLNNFNLKKPENEYIPFSKLSIIVKDKNEIEKELLRVYEGYNKKKFPIYNHECAKEERRKATETHALIERTLEEIRKKESNK